MNCVSPLYADFFNITVNIFSPPDFLNNISFYLAYSIVRILFIIHI